MNEIVIINYDMGNIGSVAKKISRIGYSPVITNDPKLVLSASKILLPGVGHFASGVRRLKNYGLWDALNEAVLEKKIPILGICLGMQLMAKSSEEGEENGFGWIDSQVVRFNVEDKIKFKIPHTGWNHTEVKKSSKLFDGVDLEPGFYFVHAYHMECDTEEDILTITDYSYPFVSGIERDNVFGVQFHPEKSHKSGEKLFVNFLKQK